MTEPTKDQDIERLRQALNALGEHFDTVQIFATRHEPAHEGGTITVQLGQGNWFARLGHVSDWLVRQNEDTREATRKVNREED